MRARPGRLLAASTWLSTVAIVGGLIVPGTSRSMRPSDVERREVDDLRADLYLPPYGRHPAIVLVPGALREGRRYEPLVAAARSLAGCGYAVLVPELGRLRRLVLGQDALDDLVGAARAVVDLPGVQPGGVGLFGFSLGGSLALLAAGDVRLQRRVACVASVGGYFRLIDMLSAATTGRVGAAHEPVSLEPPSIYAVCASVVAQLPEADRIALERALEERPEAPLQAIAQVDEATGARARAVLALLRNRDPAAVLALVQDVPGMTEMMTTLSPEGALDRVEAPAFVLHDERDRYVPSQQSRVMREAVAGRNNFRFFSTRVLEHTEPAAPSSHPARLVGDYLPGLVHLAQFVHGSLAALKTAHTSGWDSVTSVEDQV